MRNRNIKKKNTKRRILSRIVRMKGGFLTAYLDYLVFVYIFFQYKLRVLEILLQLSKRPNCVLQTGEDYG